MFCCGSFCESNFCPECGKMISKQKVSCEIREYLGETLSDTITNIAVIDGNNLEKTVSLHKMYGELYGRDTIGFDIKKEHAYNKKYVESFNDALFNLGKHDLRIVDHYLQNNILCDMKIPHFYPYRGQTIEEFLIQCLNKNICIPTSLHHIKCDKKCEMFTTTTEYIWWHGSSERKYEYQNKYRAEKTLLNSICSDLAKLTKNLYLLDNKIYTLDELNDKYCNNTVLSIDWSKCSVKNHHIQDVQINVLSDDVCILLKRLEENFRIKKILPVIKLVSGKDSSTTSTNTHDHMLSATDSILNI
jgi:hypothetical protein